MKKELKEDETERGRLPGMRSRWSLTLAVTHEGIACGGIWEEWIVVVGGRKTGTNGR